MSFLWPQYLWMLLAAPLLIWAYLALLNRRKRALNYASLRTIKEAIAGSGPSPATDEVQVLPGVPLVEQLAIFHANVPTTPPPAYQGLPREQQANDLDRNRLRAEARRHFLGKGVSTIDGNRVREWSEFGRFATVKAVIEHHEWETREVFQSHTRPAQIRYLVQAVKKAIDEGLVAAIAGDDLDSLYMHIMATDLALQHPKKVLDGFHLLAQLFDGFFTILGQHRSIS